MDFLEKLQDKDYQIELVTEFFDGNIQKKK